MATNSTITITINAQNNATSTINSVNAALGGISSSGGTATNVMNGLKTAVLGVTAVLGGLAAAGIGVLANATNQAAEFEQALANVKAATGATSDQMAAMRKEALGIGSDTSKSAKEAVDAMGELAKAGMAVNDITSGVARAVVNLSEATDYSMTESAVLVSNSVNSFKQLGLTAQDAAETLARTANASAVGMGDLSYTIQNAGSVAAAAKIPFKDLMVATGILGNNAMKGADAGTSLKTMLLSLMAPSKDAGKALQFLGVSIYDENENFRNFKDVLGDLNTALSVFSDEGRSMYLKDIFGSDAIRAANILLKEGTEGWDAFAAAMDAAPSIAEQSATRLATLQGKIDGFKGSIETANIVIGEAFLPVLARMTDGLNKAFNSVDWERTGAGLGAVIELITTSDPETRIVQYEKLAEVLGSPRAAERVALLTSSLIGLGEALTGNWVGGLDRIRNGLQGLGGDQAVSGFNSLIQSLSTFAPVAEAVQGAISGVVAAVANELPKISKEVGPSLAYFNSQLVLARQELPGFSASLQEATVGFGTFAEAVVKAYSAVEKALAPILLMFSGAILPGAIRAVAEFASQVGIGFGLVGNIISATVDLIDAIFKGKWDETVAAAGRVFTNFYELVKMQIESIPRIFDALTGGLMTKINSFGQEIGKLAGQAWTGQLGPKGGPPDASIAVEARAEGGPVDAFAPYLVGENGPELIIPGTDGIVIPADQTSDIMGDLWRKFVFPDSMLDNISTQDNGVSTNVNLDINLTVQGTVNDDQQRSAAENIAATVLQMLQGEFKRMALGAAL